MRLIDELLRAWSVLTGAMLALVSSCSPLSPGSGLDGGRIVVTNQVLIEAPARLGVNLGKSAYYGDQQLASNPFGHGGFEQGRQQLGMHVGASTADTITDARADANDPDSVTVESFAGGEYYIATGARAGETGQILANEPGSGVFTLEHSGAPLAVNDYVWLHGPPVPRALPDGAQGEQMLGIGDFRLEADEGITHEFVPDPDDPANQVVQLNFPDGGPRQGGVKHYIAATPNTTYTVRFRARSTLPAAEVGVRMVNLGIAGNMPGQEVPFRATGGGQLGSAWRDYVFSGKTYANSDIAKSFSAISIMARGAAGVVMLDDLTLEDDHTTHPTGFTRQVVETLKEARCGVLRFYGVADMGALSDQFTAENSTQAAWSFLSLSSFFRFDATDTVVDQWMLLAQEVGARPWINVGNANHPDDWYRLISYLAAPAAFDADAQRRAAHGFEQPWTVAFDKIYLEIGNEWWNGIFTPYHIQEPARYGELCRNLIARVKSHPHFDAAKIEIIADGWAVNGNHWNGIVDAQSEGHDRISIAPYLLYELNNTGSAEDKYLSLFADVDSFAQGVAQSTLDDMNTNNKGTGRAVYEINTHTTTGAATPQVVSEMAPSLAAGIAVLDQAMSVMATMQTDPVCYFTLLQRAYDDRLGLWGTLLRTPAGELRPRPVWHGLRLANQYLIAGAMVKTEVESHLGWDQAENGSVSAMDDVPYLHAYAFRAGDNAINLLAINRHLSEPLDASVSLPFEASRQCKRILLTGERPEENNEEQETVRLQEETVRNFRGTISLPPCSAAVYQLRS